VYLLAADDGVVQKGGEMFCHRRSILRDAEVGREPAQVSRVDGVDEDIGVYED